MALQESNSIVIGSGAGGYRVFENWRVIKASEELPAYFTKQNTRYYMIVQELIHTDHFPGEGSGLINPRA